MFTRMKELLADLLFPYDKCFGCGAYLDQKDILCDACKQDYLIGKDARICDRCGRPLLDREMFCEECLGEDRSVQNRALFIYTGHVRRCVIGMKFFGDETACHAFGWALGQHFRDAIEACDHVIPMPLSPEGLKDRGYNQTHIMALGMLGLVYEHKLLDGILLRRKNTLQQAKLTSRPARYENVKSAFSVGNKEALAGKKLLLLDDIFTTGATMEAARKALLKAGALEVRCITLCVRVPRTMRKSVPENRYYRAKTIKLSKIIKSFGRKINKTA